MKENKNVYLKISGQEDRVKIVLEKIESLFPLFLESKLLPNDCDDGCHCWLTIGLMEEPIQ
jgi:hypothetical protein